MTSEIESFREQLETMPLESVLDAINDAPFYCLEWLNSIETKLLVSFNVDGRMSFAARCRVISNRDSLLVARILSSINAVPLKRLPFYLGIRNAAIQSVIRERLEKGE